MTQETVALIEPIISQPFFNFEVMKGKSLAAAYLANWVVNIVTYNNIYRKVKPLMDAFAQATESKTKAESALAVVQERVKELNGTNTRAPPELRHIYYATPLYIHIHTCVRVCMRQASSSSCRVPA